MNQKRSMITILLCGFLAVLQPISVHAKLSDFSSATKWIGGGAVAVGGLYLGLSLWQKSLERELKREEQKLPRAQTAYDKFMLSNKIFELREDISSLKTIRKVLGFGGAGFGVGLVGLLGRDWGRKQAKPAVVNRGLSPSVIQAPPGAVEQGLVYRFLSKVQSASRDLKVDFTKAVMRDRGKKLPDTFKNYEKLFQSELQYFREPATGADAATVYGWRAHKLAEILDLLSVEIGLSDRAVAKSLLVNGDRRAIHSEEEKYMGHPVGHPGAGVQVQPVEDQESSTSDVEEERRREDAELVTAKIKSLLSELEKAQTDHAIGVLQAKLGVLDDTVLGVESQKNLREDVSAALEKARMRVKDTSKGERRNSDTATGSSATLTPPESGSDNEQQDAQGGVEESKSED